MNIDFFAERQHLGDVIAIYAVSRVGDEKAIAKPLIFERMESDGAQHEPTLKLRVHAAQSLMDELWRCGLRPTEGTGSAGALAATERHLKDMQAICFKFLDDGKSTNAR